MIDVPGDTPEFIVVEGPIGVGKTSLVNRLSQMTDADLAECGLHRDDIPKTAAAAAHLFGVAHKAEKNY